MHGASAKRVAQWSCGKNFVSMVNTLRDAFEPAQPLAGLATVGLLTDASSNAELKKAFFKASKVLHPDKVRALPAVQRAEAEEVFKALSAAYHAIETRS